MIGGLYHEFYPWWWEGVYIILIMNDHDCVGWVSGGWIPLQYETSMHFIFISFPHVAKPLCGN